MAFKLLLAGLAVFHTVTAQQGIPTCLQACLTQVGTNLCADDALSKLTPCLSTTCNNPASTQNLIASLDVAFTPKAEYACQQAYGPANADKEASSVTLPLDGTCATSPYDFKSFLPDGVSRINASNGCRIMLFSQEDCLGEAADTEIGTLSNGMCVFRGGRSARLTCRNEVDAARAYIQTSCGKDDDSDEPASESSSSTPRWGPGPVSLSTGTSASTMVYPSSAPYHGPGPTSSGTDSSSSIPFHWPFSSDTAFSTGTGLTDTADAKGTSAPSTTSSDATPTLGLPPASIIASGNGSTSGNGTASSHNGTETSVSSPDSQNASAVLSLTLTGTPTADVTSPPPYTGLAAPLNGGIQTSVALGLVGAGFAMFL